MQGRSNPMSDLLLLPGQIRQEVTKMVRSVLRIGFWLLLMLLLIFMMLSAGWIKIIFNVTEVFSDIKKVGKENVSQPPMELEPKNSLDENQLFKVEYHVVSPGETLFDLERSYRTNWKVIQRINKIEDPLRLRAGTIIRVPVRIADS